VSLVGGFLIHLVIGPYINLGTFSLWGSLNIYVTSYYRLHSDPELTLEIASLIFPLIGIFLGGSL